MKNNQPLSNRGGKRPGAGRKAGVPNKVNADLRELAQQYTTEALEALVGILRGDNESAKVSAAREILDRGHGKASQPVEGKLGLDITAVIHKVIDPNAFP